MLDSDRCAATSILGHAPRFRTIGGLALLTLHVGCGGAQPPVETAKAITTPPAVSAAPPPPTHWTYEGDDGPAHWGDLSPDFALCKSGTSQTPIDLPAKRGPKGKLSPLSFEYQPFPLELFNNGHTVEVESTAPNAITLDGARYDLVQFHVHTPSEHTVGGKHFEMELHLVHKNAEGQLAVVGILFKKGKESTPLKPIWSHLPTTPEKQLVEGVKIDLGPLLPKKAGYWSYEGSLTTPKCSEGVRWFVLDATSEASAAQLDALKAVLHGANARPIQDAKGRKVSRFTP